MESINASKCKYCGKVYKLKSSCKSHEYRCYFNPRTKSCASCRNLEYLDFYYKPGYSLSVRTCLKNIDISRQIRTYCPQYETKKQNNDLSIKPFTTNSYNPLPTLVELLKSQIKKVKLDEKDPSSEKYMNYFKFLSEANIGELIHTIGAKILLLSFVKNGEEGNTINNKSLNEISDVCLEQYDNILYLLNLSGIGDTRVKRIINEVSRKLPISEVVGIILINTGIQFFHNCMAKACEIMEDHKGKSYHMAQQKNTFFIKGISSLIAHEFSEQKLGYYLKETFDCAMGKFKLIVEKEITQTDPELKADIMTSMVLRRLNPHCFEIPIKL